MKLIRRFTVVEWLTIFGVLVILGGLLLPDSATTTRWSLEKRARNFAATPAATLTDDSIIATDVNITGTWTCRHRMNWSSYAFTARPDGKFNADFRTGGCLGGCELQRTARFDRGAIRLDAAVAEYLPRTYNTLYSIRIADTVYLLPAEWLPDFERELDSDSDRWQWYVYRRGNDANEPKNAPQRRAVVD